VFGFGAGLFFFGDFLGEVPGNPMLNVVGACRRQPPAKRAPGCGPPPASPATLERGR